MRLRLRIDLALALLITLSAGAQESPEAAVRDFLTRYAAGDASGASRLWVAGPPAEAFRKRHARRLERRCLRLESLTVRPSAADPADIETLETFAVGGRQPGSREWIETSASRFRLQHDGGRWRIASWEPRERELVDRLARAADAAERTRILDASPELQTTTLARLLSQRAVDLVNLDQYESAGALAAEAQSLAERLGDPASIAWALRARSILVRVGSKDLQRSHDLGVEAVSLAEQAGDPDVLARSLLALARTVETLETLPDLGRLRRGIALAGELEDPAIAPIMATHLSRSYEVRGRLFEAYRYAALAAQFADETDDPAAMISASIILAAAYMWTGDSHLAERYYQRVCDLAAEAGFPGGGAHGRAGLAIIASGTHRPQDALRILEEALCLAVTPEEKAWVLRVQTLVYVNLGRVDLAERALNEAVELVPPNATIRQPIELGRGNIAMKAGDYDLALDHYAAARGADIRADHEARLKYAEVLQCLSRLDEARGVVDEVTAGPVLGALMDPERELFSAADRSYRHSLLIQLLAEQGQLLRALEVAEQAKAYALGRALMSHGVDVRQWSAEDRTREIALNDRIRALNRELFAADRPEGDAAVLRKQLDDARDDLLDFRQRRYARQIEPGQRPGWDPDLVVLNLEGLPPQLDDTAIVLYVSDNAQTFVFAVTPKRQGHRFLKMGTIGIGDRELASRVARFATLVGERNLNAPEAAAEMYDLLLGPVDEAFASAKALCIIPEASLWRIPFHALGRRDGPPLVDRMPVFYAPSIAVLTAAESRRDGRDHGRSPALLAFANPRVTAETASLYRSIVRDAPVGAIPETETEVRAIAEIYGPAHSRIFIGDQARESVLKREAPRYDVLHIATHGLAHHYAPMFSSLLLTTAPEDRTEDGVLEAREIAELDLDVDLAVLSACETGKAEDTGGDGVIGLSWALLAAGCPTTVVSQWKTESAATAKLMIEFHRHAARGVPAPEALRRAQLALRADRRYRHAFYWAPFIVVGAP